MSAPHSRLQRALPPLLVFVATLVLWKLAVVLFRVPEYLVPAPEEVLSQLQVQWRELLAATWVTAKEAICGFVLSLLIGSLVAFVFSQSRWIRNSFYPYAIFLQTVPIVAIAPLIAIWSGYGFRSVVIVSVIISLFPVITNGTAGLLAVPAALEELFSVNDATRLQFLLKCRLPNSVPYFIAGAKVSSGLSVIGAIVGELFVGYGGDEFGLGYVVYMAGQQLKTAHLFAAILLSTLLGLAIFGFVGGVGDWMLARWHADRLRDGTDRPA